MTPTQLEEFKRLIGTVLDRYARQNGLELLYQDEKSGLAARLGALVEARGLPPPLATDERGEPGEMSPEEVAPLVAAVLEPVSKPERWSVPARQLVKACFLPEFKKCRDSYREAEADGTCRRQQLSRANERISGSHCVDCPYWTTLKPEQHEKFLAKAWVAGAEYFAAHRGVFLPEDFRALRQWLRAMARQ